MQSIGSITATLPFHPYSQSKTLLSASGYGSSINGAFGCLNSLTKIRTRFSAFSVCSAITKKDDEGEKVRSFDFQAYMEEKTEQVNKALADSVPVTANNTVVRQAMRYSLLSGGKRIRPILCIAACELVGGQSSDAMAGACVVEMVHTMSLVHDDLPSMDNDDRRHGKAATHKVFGESAAILAGDSLLALAVDYIVSQTHIPPARLLAAVGETAKYGERLAIGQAADLLSTGKPDVGLDELEFIHAHKTGALVVAAVALGALLGGGKECEVESLRKYAKSVGLLLQVVDDILDVTRSSEELGKTAGKDVAAGKATYPKLMGLDKAKEYARRLNMKAKEHLSEFDQQKAAPLIALADYIAHRQN